MISDTARLLIDVNTGPTKGGWNMAVDEALLETANKTGQASVRFYSWQQATLSLGYFQRWADRASHAASFSCTVVRRSTGGGAILHDRELTYSICLPSQNRWCQSHEELYWKIHRSINQWLGQHGIMGGLHREVLQFQLHQISDQDAVSGNNRHSQELETDPQHLQPRHGEDWQEPFLCFQRRTAGDVVLDGHKIMGSAQRRKQNALLQHGSLLLAQSDYAPQLPGIFEISPIQGAKLVAAYSLADLANELVHRFEEVLETSLIPCDLTDSERGLAQEIQIQHASDDWLKKR